MWNVVRGLGVGEESKLMGVLRDKEDDERKVIEKKKAFLTKEAWRNKRVSRREIFNTAEGGRSDGRRYIEKEKSIELKNR